MEGLGYSDFDGHAAVPNEGHQGGEEGLPVPLPLRGWDHFSWWGQGHRAHPPGDRGNGHPRSEHQHPREVEGALLPAVRLQTTTGGAGEKGRVVHQIWHLPAVNSNEGLKKYIKE